MQVSSTESPLGKNVPYITTYSPAFLFPIARNVKRAEMGVTNPLPFEGVDIWNAYELSWLEQTTRKPRVAMAEFYVPCQSESLIESKSFKLYLNSLNQSTFKSETELKNILQQDISKAVGMPVRVNFILPPFKPVQALQEFSGVYLDDLPVEITTFFPDPLLLKVESGLVTETLYSNLLKSNCLVTGQPDWASLFIQYHGHKINHAGLLKYIVSYREHSDLHEQCVEQIFMDILRQCAPEKLTVYARYTRRGGLDINPFRSNFQSMPANIRNFRQ
ncbi:MAG TPA: NADPH-dependent 7-cyano-7-deazaguanine reductase QueF [Gammaproteobacteria bacterium]|nr:NADPH-dependent 7-cyano-7-deazaguanine reductase QueF [Gammaproteobacteria bacterium]